MDLEGRIEELRQTPARWWAGEAEVVRVYFSQAKAHLRLRNETFGYALTEERMREIDAAVDIAPLPVDYANVSPYSV